MNDRVKRLIAADPAHVEPDAGLGSRTTYRVGGNVDGLLHLVSRTQLELVAPILRDEPNVVVLGNGSNVLIADEGVRGVAIVLEGEFVEMDITPDGDGARVLAGAGMDLPRAARRCVEAGLAGFTWAVGVPGTFGGAVAMNAGGHGSDMAHSVVSVELLNLDTGELVRRTRDEMSFSYRHSSLTSRHVALSVELWLPLGDQDDEKALLSEIVRWRRANQPGGTNAGSVFTNPEGDSAGRLIEAAGLKGYRIGSAAVSEKHANFIQADAGGRAADVAALIRFVSDAVYERFGVTLTPENRLVGFNS